MILLWWKHYKMQVGYQFKSPLSKHKDIVSPWDNDFNILKAKFFHTGKLYTFLNNEQACMNCESAK